MHREQTAPWDDRDEDPTTANPFSRRHLLGVAAGGLALGASGLLLPDWLIDEAEADNHPVRRIQKRKEHKREQRHRRGHRRERQRQDTGHDRERAPGGGPWDVSFYVYNDTPVTTPNGKASIEPWYVIGHDRNDMLWEPGDTKQVANGTWAGKFTRNGSNYAGVLINNDFLITADNPAVWWPLVRVAQGGEMDIHGYRHGGYLMDPKGLDEQEQVETYGGGYHFTIKRLYDVKHQSGGEKVFDFHFRPV